MTGTNRGLNQESVQDMNRTLLISLLRQEGICSRVHLAKLSYLKQATVTNIMNDFIDWGIVKEVGFLIGEKGRRSIGISINNDDYGVLGIRLARKNYTAGIFDLSGNMVDYQRDIVKKSQSARETFDHIINIAEGLINQTSQRRILAVGMALPGPYSISRKRIELMTGVPGWEEISIQEELQERFGLPVFIEQDANTGALAQYWHHGEKYLTDSMIYIAVGQGVGAGIIVNGELQRGCIGVAGEIGHMSIDVNGEKCACGNYGCLEMYCSSIAFTREVNAALSEEKEYFFPEVSQMVKAGRKEAVDIYLKCCDYLAAGVVNVINSFNPSTIVLGDEMAHVDPARMLERVKARVKERSLPETYSNTEIIGSVIKEDSMVHGAAITAIRDIFRKPNDYFT